MTRAQRLSVLITALAITVTLALMWRYYAQTRPGGSTVWLLGSIVVGLLCSAMARRAFSIARRSVWVAVAAGVLGAVLTAALFLGALISTYGS